MYILSWKQLFVSVITIAVFTALSVAIVILGFDYLERPEVLFDQDNKCIKVINYRNGDAYTCQDVKVTLRNFGSHVVQPASASAEQKQ